MLNAEDIKNIEKMIRIVGKNLETKNFKLLIKEMLEEGNKELSLVAEDSGFIVGNLGGFSYIFVRTFVINDKGKKFSKSKFYLLPYAFFEGKRIDDLADIISRTIEYFLTLEFIKKEKPDVVLIDGSLISDLIQAAVMLSLFKKENYFDTFVEFLNQYSNYLDIEEIDYALLEDLPKIFITFYIKTLRDFLQYVKDNNILVFYFIKRPVDSKRLAEKIAPDLSRKFNDYLLLNIVFRNKAFVTDLYKQELEGQAIRQLFIDILENYYFVYFRKVPNGHIYRIEIPAFYNENEIKESIFSILNKYSDVQGYPRLLLLAHKLCNVSLKDKKIIERLLISKLKDFVVPEATR